MASRRHEFLAGGRDVFPLAAGVASLMMVWGAVALSAGIPAWMAQLMTLIVFAGSQFVMVQLIAVGTPAGMIIAASSLLNLRHLLYSASVAPFLKELADSGKVWPFYAGSSSLCDEFLRKSLAVRSESTEKFGQAASIILALFWYKSRF